MCTSESAFNIAVVIALLLPLVSSGSSPESRPSCTVQLENGKKSVGAAIESEALAPLIRQSVRTARILLKRFPPAKYAYVFLGLQSVGISEASRWLAPEAQIVDLPVHGLNWAAVIRPKWVEDFLRDRLTAAGVQSGKELVLIRTLNFGSTLRRISSVLYDISENDPNVKLNMFFVTLDPSYIPPIYYQLWGSRGVWTVVDPELVGVTTEQGMNGHLYLNQNQLAQLSRYQSLDAKKASQNRYNKGYQFRSRRNSPFSKAVRAYIENEK